MPTENKVQPEVKRYAGKLPSSTYVVLASDYDAAQSELAALREELAARNKYPDWVQVEIHKNGIEERDADIEQLQKRLADAERRNDAMVGLLHRAQAVIGGEGWNELEADICAALTTRDVTLISEGDKPEEAKS